MPRWRREHTTADQIQVGDVIEPGNVGHRATVTGRRTSRRIDGPTSVELRWRYPENTSVPAYLWGMAAGEIHWSDDPITRWHKPST